MKILDSQKYLSIEKTKELLLELKKEYEKIQTIESRFKKLMLEECQTAKYEILILSGNSISTLFEQAQTEDDKIALAKAYYNISNPIFRENSGYFDTDNKNWNNLLEESEVATEIQNRILQMQLNRYDTQEENLRPAQQFGRRLNLSDENIEIMNSMANMRDRKREQYLDSLNDMGASTEKYFK